MERIAAEKPAAHRWRLGSICSRCSTRLRSVRGLVGQDLGTSIQAVRASPSTTVDIGTPSSATTTRLPCLRPRSSSPGWSRRFRVLLRRCGSTVMAPSGARKTRTVGCRNQGASDVPLSLPPSQPGHGKCATTSAYRRNVFRLFESSRSPPRSRVIQTDSARTGSLVLVRRCSVAASRLYSCRSPTAVLRPASSSSSVSLNAD